MTKIVFDVGGTNIRVALVESGALKDIVKVESPQDGKEGLKILVDTIKEVSKGEVEAIVGGIAGVISRDGVILHSPNLPGWDRSNLADTLKEKICGNVVIKNDALMAGLGEATYGIEKKASVVAYIGLGTGIGGCRIVNRSIDESHFEPGHHILDTSLLESWEQKVSGHTLKAKYPGYPKKLDKTDYDECVRGIAVGVYNAILFWGPDVLVLGGSLINGKVSFKVSDIVNEVEKINKVLPILPEIIQSKLGDDAGLYGAMAVLENNYSK